ISMVEKTPETVEKSLCSLSEAIGKATDDLCAARDTIERARADIAAQNTSVSREAVTDAERVIDSLKRTDVGLREVGKELAERGENRRLLRAFGVDNLRLLLAFRAKNR